MGLYTAPISIAGTTGDSTVMAAQSNQIKIRAISFSVDSATNVSFKNGSTALSGAYPLTAYQNFYLPDEGNAHFVLGTGEAFVINQSGTANIGGTIWYTKG